MEYEIITPVELKYFHRITVLHRWVAGPLTCEVVLCDRDGEPTITAVFEGLSEIETLKVYGGGCIGPLKVLDVSDWQWEGIKYKVRDFEEEFISFYCNAFSVRHEQKSTLIR